MSKRKRRKRIGEPLPKSADEQAEITPEDIELAREWVRKYGSPRMIAMLDAEAAGSEDFE